MTTTEQQTVTLSPISGTAAYRISGLTINDQGIAVQLSIGLVDAEGVYAELMPQYHSLSPSEASEVLSALPAAVVKGETALAMVEQVKTAALNKLRALGRVKI